MDTDISYNNIDISHNNTDISYNNMNKLDSNVSIHLDNYMINNINALTLEYFSNSGLYNKSSNKVDIEKNITQSDKKFYKKRIVNSTKNMLKGEFENDLLKDIFYKYIFSLISHFKRIDTYEILQKEINLDTSSNDLHHSYDTHYSHFSSYTMETTNEQLSDTSENDKDLSCISIPDLPISNPNELLFKKNETKVLMMDNFIQKRTIQKEKPKLPIKKQINLREPEFKTKGIQKKVKKENIDNV